MTLTKAGASIYNDYMEQDIKTLNNRRQIFDDILRNLAYVLFAGVILVVMQGFFSLGLLGKVKNTTSNNSHFMHYTQYYLKFCAMFLALVLVIYYALKIVRVCEDGNASVKRFFKAHGILIPLAVMLVWAFIATMKSPDVEKSLYGSGYINEGFFTVLQYGTVFLSAYAIREELKFSKTAVLWTFVLLAGLVCFIFVGCAIVDYRFYTTRRVGIFNNSNHYGYFLAMSTTATFGLLAYSKKTWQTVLLSFLLAFNVYNLFYCNTLGANLAYIGGIIFVVCSGFMTKKIVVRNLVLAIIVSAVVTLIIEASGITNMWKSYVRLFQDFGLIADEATGGDSDSSMAGTGRLGLWRRTIKVIQQVPWFGKGLDLYYKNNIYDTNLDVPHNEYLAIASNMGIPGLVMYLVTIIWWFARGVKQRKTLTTSDLTLMAGAFAYLISAFFGNSFTYTYPYFLVLWAMSIQSPKSSNNYESNQIVNSPIEQKFDRLHSQSNAYARAQKNV